MLLAASKREPAKNLSVEAIDRMAVRILNSEAAKSCENSHLIPENEPKSKSGSGLHQNLNDDQDQNLAGMDINRNGQQSAQPETTSDSKPVAKPKITQADKTGSNHYSKDPDRAVEQAVADAGGHKSLYSDAYYDRQTFDALYGGPAWATVNNRYDPHGRLTGMYEKVVGANGDR